MRFKHLTDPAKSALLLIICLLPIVLLAIMSDLLHF